MKLICDLNQQTGAMPTRWCLEEIEQSEITRRGLTKLFVVIDVFYADDLTGHRDETRQRFVLPINRYMQYISFRRPGVAYVCAALVTPRYSSDKSVEEMQSALGAEYDNSSNRKNRLFNFSDTVNKEDREVTLYRDGCLDCKCEVLGITHVKVEVPNEYFAKPLTGWLKWWVEFFPRELLRRKLVDQCDQRRWAIFAFTVQPIMLLVATPIVLVIMAVIYVATIVIGLYWSVWAGRRRVDWSRILTFKDSPKDVTAGVSTTSRYDFDSEGNPRPFVQRLLQPAVLVLVLGGVIATTATPSLSGEAQISWFALIGGVLVGAVGLATLLPSLSDAIREATADSRSNRQERERQAQKERVRVAEQASRDRVAELVSDLSCPVRLAEGSANTREFLRPEAVPAQHRTLRLRFDALKAHVCRPLAK